MIIIYKGIEEDFFSPTHVTSSKPALSLLLCLQWSLMLHGHCAYSYDRLGSELSIRLRDAFIYVLFMFYFFKAFKYILIF